jgi:hypothetical protein
MTFLTLMRLSKRMLHDPEGRWHTRAFVNNKKQFARFGEKSFFLALGTQKMAKKAGFSPQTGQFIKFCDENQAVLRPLVAPCAPSHLVLAFGLILLLHPSITNLKPIYLRSRLH